MKLFSLFLKLYTAMCKSF